MSQKFLVNGFEDISSIDKKLKKLIKLKKNDDEDSDKGHIFEVHIEYPKYLHDLHSDLPFLPKRISINKCHKLACNLYDKKAIIHIRNIK